MEYYNVQRLLNVLVLSNTTIDAGSCCCLSTHMTLASGGESDVPACGPPASFSVHLASSAVTTAGSVDKSRGDNVVRNNNNNNNCLKSNIQCIEIRVQWTVHLGSSHMHVHAVTRVHAVTPKLVICVMYLTSI